jgi:hypothetical protein
VYASPNDGVEMLTDFIILEKQVSIHGHMHSHSHSLKAQTYTHNLFFFDPKQEEKKSPFPLLL